MQTDRIAPRPAKPHKPGTIIGTVPAAAVQNATHLTPLELEVARRTNIDPAQLPALKNSAVVQRLNAEIAGVKAAAATASPAELAAAPKTSLNNATERDISELSPAERAEVEYLVQTYKQIEATPQPEPLPPALKSIPGMEDAFRVAQASPTPPEPPAERLPPLKAYPPAADTTAVDPAPAETPAGAFIEKTECQHCGQDLRRVAPTVSDVDKLSYLQEVVLGGKRFRKAYPLFGGHMQVVFRSLLAEEAEMAVRQAEADFVAQRVRSSLGYLEKAREYRLIASIESLQRGSSPPQRMSPLLDYENSPGEPSPLLSLMTYFNTQVFNTDTLKRSVGQRFVEFTLLCEHLETQSNNSDFWSAIGSGA